MNQLFLPPRRTGLVFHTILILLLIMGSSISLDRATQTNLGSQFVLALGGFLGFAVPIPLLVYRAYALFRGAYELKPNGVMLRWGLRIEEIPMEKIRWVSLESDLVDSLPSPWLRLPGSVMGTRRLRNNGLVEYMAAHAQNPVIVATVNQLYAITPQDPEKFIQEFQHLSEMGSLTPLEAQSKYPTMLLSEIWQDPLSRYLLLGGLSLSLGLLVWLGIFFPIEAGKTYLLQIEGMQDRLINASQLLFIPILNAVFFLVDLLAGLFFFRRPENRPLAYMVWTSSVITSLLFLGAVLFILSAA